MDTMKGVGLHEYSNLFEIKCTFDPLKSVLKKITDRQNELEIEVKLLRDGLKLKAEKKDFDDINQKLSSNTSIIDSKIKVFKDRFEEVRKENSIFHQKIIQFEKSQTDAADYSKMLIKELEKKSIRIDNTVSQHRLDFENYINCFEKYRWEDKHKAEEEKHEINFALVEKLETSVEEISTKVHRQINDNLAVNEKLSDLETKIILLIQVAKSSTGGDSSHIFDGIGEVMSAVDYLKESMNSQYAKLTEFKEAEKSVETLNNFYLEEQEEKIRQAKEKEKLMEKFQDLKDSMDHITNEMQHLKDERFKMFEDQLVEKLDYNEFEITINNIVCCTDFNYIKEQTFILTIIKNNINRQK